MPRIVGIAIALAFLLERVTSQDEMPSADCMNATNLQQTACQNVTGINICSGECGNAYQAVFTNCTAQVSLILVQL